MAALPVSGLLITDLGFFGFLWFDIFTDQQKYFVTRMREKTAIFAALMDDLHEPSIDIIDRADQRMVTVIEMHSPINKR